MKKKQEKTVEAVLYIAAAALIICCMSSLPTWAAYIVKTIAAIMFACSSYNAFTHRKTIRGLVFLILTLVFQPFFAIPLGSFIWTCVEIGVIVYLVYLLFFLVRGSKKGSHKNKRSKV